MAVKLSVKNDGPVIEVVYGVRETAGHLCYF